MAAFLIGCTLATAQQAPAPPPFRDGTVLVGFKAGIPESSGQAAVSAVGAVVSKQLEPGIHVLAVRAGTVLAAVQALRARPEVLYAEPDYLQHADGLPNDPSFPLQWGLLNSGQSVNGTTGSPGADERATAAWNVTTGGTSVVVAVVDTGIDYTHPDLAPNVWSNSGGVNGCAAGTHGYNVLNSSCDPMDDDTQYGGHGTHVAGIIGAAGNNGVGVTGVNWTARIMGVKWISSTGSGYTSDLITALNWVVNAKKAGVNVRVVNDSATWAGTALSQALSDTIDLLGANDILFVSASGNTAQNNDATPRYPCVYDRPNQICVAASDQTDHLWSSANWGATTVNMAAPGVNIYSTLRNSTYGFISGGSMACAEVSGAAVLILSTGYQSVANLKADILNNVDVLSSLSGLVATGGRLDVCNAITGCALVTGPPANTSPPTITGATRQGQVLTAAVGTWSPSPNAYAYQWNRCNSSGANCTAINGATASTYTLMATADIGATISVTVTASNGYGAGAATSAATAVVSAAPAVSWTVTANIADGQTVCGKAQWQAFTSIGSSGVSSVQFYIDGAQSWTDNTPPYAYGANGYLDTSTLSAGSHVFAVRAIATDATVAYYSASASAGFCPGAISLAQQASVQGTSVTSLSKAFPNNDTAGNLIIAFVRASTTSQTVTVSDSAANTYAEAVGQSQSSDGHQIHIFYAWNIAGRANTVTASFSGNNKHPWLAIYEYAGLSATNPLDKTAHAQGSGTVVSSGSTAATAAASELVFAGAGMKAGWSGQITAGNGYSLLQSNVTGSAAATESQAVSAIGTYAGTFTLDSSANWSAVVATFIAPPAPAPAVTTASLPGGTVNAAYSATLAASGGTPPYSWFIASGALPAGLTLASSTGTISGTPTVTGTSNFTVEVSDAQVQTATKALSVTISSVSSPTVTTTSLPTGTVDASYNAALAASGGVTPYSWSITLGSLLAGLTLTSSTGAISGTPTTAGTSNFTVQVTDANSQTASKALSITINPANTPTITTASLPSGTVNVSYSTTLAASGGVTPYSWSITVGSLPAGLTLTSSTGAISGTPTTAGTSNFTVQVTDANSQTASKALSITINPALGGGTIALVQSNAVQGSGVSSVSQSFTSANTAGNLIVAFVRMSTTSQAVTVSDTAGNGYVAAVSQAQTSDGHQTFIFYATNIKGGANTVTALFSSTNNHPWLAIYEYSGVSAPDQTARAQGGNSTPACGPTAATSFASELVFVGLGLPSSSGVAVTAGAGYGLELQDTIQNGSRAATEDRLVSSTGAYTGSFSLSGAANWSCLVATFR
jgi:subtilisin family serine protease